MRKARMHRRSFIRVLGGASGWPLTARAQQAMRKLGVLMIGTEDEQDSKLRIAALQDGLRDLGWKDGENIRIDYRWAEGRSDLIRRYSDQLVALAPDVILANGAPVVAALKPLTHTIPIVFANVFNPVGMGLVENLSRPGGNITGFTFVNPDLVGKWAELLNEAAPKVDRAAFFYSPKINPFYPELLRELETASRSVALKVEATAADTVEDLQARIGALASVQGASLIIGADGFMIAHIDEIAALATANHLPGISVYRQFATAGGLMAYGPDVPDIFRRSAGYVDRILRGEKPGDLPVQQPTKFELVLNLKTASHDWLAAAWL